MGDCVSGLGRPGGNRAIGTSGRIALDYLPELVYNFDVLFSDSVPLVVRRLFGVAKVPRGRVEVTGNNVPAHSPPREVVDCAQPTGEVV